MCKNRKHQVKNQSKLIFFKTSFQLEGESHKLNFIFHEIFRNSNVAYFGLH